MRKYILLIILIVPVIAISGCVSQNILGERGIDLSLKTDDQNIFSSKDTTLYVDVENKDDHPYWKVFVDVFDPGVLGVQRTTPYVFGSVRNLTGLMVKKCTTSAECFNEDYGGCGVCLNGQCVSSQRTGIAGTQCSKTCECASNSNLGCRNGACTPLVDSNNQPLRCRGGTPYNKCALDSSGNQIYGKAGESYYCDEFGNSWSQCQGMDEIIGTADDCGCPQDKNNQPLQCRGDGTCGSFSDCFATIYNLIPGEIKTIECKLKAPGMNEIPKSFISNDVNVRMRFTNKLTAIQTIEMISEQEYKLRQYSNKIEVKPSSYTYRDKAIELDVEFSKQLPIIVRPGEKVYMYLTIRDIGGGEPGVYPVRPDEFFIIQQGINGQNVVASCDNQNPPIVLQPDGKTFPRVTCELKLPSTINYISNYQAIINLDYSYEYRKTISVGIVK
jgi:hypothetical protein